VTSPRGRGKTKKTSEPGAETVTPLILTEIVRRSGHEIRNALNGVAVNVEVVKSRVGRGSGGTEIDSFAERASSQVHVASAITDGLLALLRRTFSAQADGTLTTATSGAGSQIELMIYGDEATTFVSDIALLADKIGLGVKSSERGVILTVLPQDLSHSKE
jgi:hypothetical protein